MPSVSLSGYLRSWMAIWTSAAVHAGVDELPEHARGPANLSCVLNGAGSALRELLHLLRGRRHRQSRHPPREVFRRSVSLRRSKARRVRPTLTGLAARRYGSGTAVLVGR